MQETFKITTFTLIFDHFSKKQAKNLYFLFLITSEFPFSLFYGTKKQLLFIDASLVSSVFPKTCLLTDESKLPSGVSILVYPCCSVINPVFAPMADGLDPSRSL